MKRVGMSCSVDWCVCSVVCKLLVGSSFRGSVQKLCDWWLCSYVCKLLVGSNSKEREYLCHVLQPVFVLLGAQAGSVFVSNGEY